MGLFGFFFWLFFGDHKDGCKKKMRVRSEMFQGSGSFPRISNRVGFEGGVTTWGSAEAFMERMQSHAVKGAWSLILFYCFRFIITFFSFCCLFVFFRSVRLCHTSDTYSPGSVHIQKKNCHSRRCTCTFSVDGEPL